jgi:hypothetical protein
MKDHVDPLYEPLHVLRIADVTRDDLDSLQDLRRQVVKPTPRVE